MAQNSGLYQYWSVMILFIYGFGTKLNGHTLKCPYKILIALYATEVIKLK